jgi:cytochrome c
MKPKTYLVNILLLMLFFSCNSKNPELGSEQNAKPKVKEFFRIPGEDEFTDPEIIKKGEVLVAYSDCYQCHREESKAKGPSFSDIARRYPIQQTYIDLLARKIISGGSGTWGYPVMNAHPKISEEEAKTMVIYILSLEKSKL